MLWGIRGLEDATCLGEPCSVSINLPLKHSPPPQLSLVDRIVHAFHCVRIPTDELWVDRHWYLFVRLTLLITSICATELFGNKAINRISFVVQLGDKCLQSDRLFLPPKHKWRTPGNNSQLTEAGGRTNGYLTVQSDNSTCLRYIMLYTNLK